MAGVKSLWLNAGGTESVVAPVEFALVPDKAIEPRLPDARAATARGELPEEIADGDVTMPGAPAARPVPETAMVPGLPAASEATLMLPE